MNVKTIQTIYSLTVSLANIVKVVESVLREEIVSHLEKFSQTVSAWIP